MESSEVRTVQTACRNETELEGGSNVQKGTDHTHKRIDEAIRRRLYIEEKGMVKRFVSEASNLVSFIYFSLPTNKRYESVVACAHHHLILFLLAVKVYPFLCCFISLIGSLSSPPGQHSSMGIDS